MAPIKKYLSLEEAAGQLGLKPDELIRFREKGEVRGFADRGTWKFKADDIEEFHRRRQPDSDPDLPIMDDDDEVSRQATVIRRGGEMKSDSDVRLSLSPDEKSKRLAGSSAEMTAHDLHQSDSDVRLIEDVKPRKRDSDSDVKLVKPKAGTKSDSDSDVKMVDLPLAAPESDSDVMLLDPHLTHRDSDSDVRLANSDSDVRLAPLVSSDSDVKLIGRKSKGKKSDSDVTLLPTGDSRTKSSSKMSDSSPLVMGSDDIDFDLSGSGKKNSLLLSGDDSSITLAGEDSGIQLSGDSGIQLQGDSGIRLSELSGVRGGGDSGIRLVDDSGVQLKKPADSGISLEGHDSGVRLADSGINLGEDSGINLLAPSSKKLKKGDGSSKKLKGSKAPEHDDLDATSPMLLSSLDDDDDPATSPLLSSMDQSDGSAAELDLFNGSDTSELESMGDSGQNVVMFDDEDEDEPPVSKKKRQRTVEESIFDMDEAGEELEELEVSDDDLSGELDDMAFDDDEGDLDESFTTGASRLGIGAQKVAVAQEVEWSTGFCFMLFASLCILILGSWMSADLLKVVWDQGKDSKVDPGIAGLLAGFWK